MIDLGRAYLEAEGCEHVARTIHPDDDMLGYLAEIGRPADRRPFEYLRTGREASVSVLEVLARTGRAPGTIERALDFACGYGRLTRFLVDAIPHARLFASDVLPGAVSFVRDTLGCDAFPSATTPDAVDLPRDLDLVTVLSLFSHLPMPTFRTWLAALYDSLAPDGLLVFSTHPAASCEAPDPSGFTFLRQSESRLLDTAHYGSTFVTFDAVRSIARTCSITHLYSIDAEIGGVQDLHVVAKRPCPGLDDWSRTSFVRGGIDDLWSRDGTTQLVGWAAELGAPAPLASVRLAVDGVPIGDAAIGHEAPEVVRAFDRPDWLAAGWHLTGATPQISGMHALAAIGTTRSGRRHCFDVRAFEADAEPRLV